MIVIIIVAVLIAAAVVGVLVLQKSRNADADSANREGRLAALSDRPEPTARTSRDAAPDGSGRARTGVSPSDRTAGAAPPETAAPATAPPARASSAAEDPPLVTQGAPAGTTARSNQEAGDVETAAEDDDGDEQAEPWEPDLSRFGVPAAKPTKAEQDAAAKARFRYPMEPSLTASEPLEQAPAFASAGPEQASTEAATTREASVVSDDAAGPSASAAPVDVPAPERVATPSPAPAPNFDLDLVVVAPLNDAAGEPSPGEVDGDEGATVTRLQPKIIEAVPPVPLAEIVADLIDAADPEVAEVMARLIDASDPELVSQLVDADDLEVAEVVAKLVDTADPELRSRLAELADAPDRRQVAEVLRLVDAGYGSASGAELPEDMAEELEELDIESDLKLTSRPGEMAQFARLDNKDQLRVIIRVLCGLVAREDLPRSPRTPATPASSAENRRWPLSRARWPVPPPDDESIVKRSPLPARQASSKAS